MRPVALVLSRRSLLVATGVGVLGAAVAGCRDHDRSAAPAPDPDRAALAAAAADERELVAVYDAAIAASDAVVATRLTAARARHLEHLRVLTRRARVSAAPSTGPAPPAADLTVHLASSARRLGAAATTAVGGEVAALLASIGAEHGADLAGATARATG